MTMTEEPQNQPSPELIARIISFAHNIKDKTGPGNTKVFFVDASMVRTRLDECFGVLQWETTVIAEETINENWMIKEDFKTREKYDAFTVTCHARVALRVHFGGTSRTFSDCGVGVGHSKGKNNDVSQAFGTAKKGAVTDALKRAAAQIGNTFGRGIAKDGKQHHLPRFDHTFPAEIQAINALNGRRPEARRPEQKPKEPARDERAAEPRQPAASAASATVAPTERRGESGDARSTQGRPAMPAERREAPPARRPAEDDGYPAGRFEDAGSMHFTEAAERNDRAGTGPASDHRRADAGPGRGIPSTGARGPTDGIASTGLPDAAARRGASQEGPPARRDAAGAPADGGTGGLPSRAAPTPPAPPTRAGGTGAGSRPTEAAEPAPRDARDPERQNDVGHRDAAEGPAWPAFDIARMEVERVAGTPPEEDRQKDVKTFIAVFRLVSDALVDAKSEARLDRAAVLIGNLRECMKGRCGKTDEITRWFEQLDTRQNRIRENIVEAGRRMAGDKRVAAE